MARIRNAARFVFLVLVILGINAFLGMEILGLTYRPFSWMTLCDAGETSVYLMIRDALLSGNQVTVVVEGSAPGTDVSLIRSPSLPVPDWQPASERVPGGGTSVALVDTNPPGPPVFYRAVQSD